MSAWRGHSLSLVLAFCFALSWAAQFVWQVGVGGGDVWQFWSSTFENWQSEFLQLLCFVLFTKWFVEKGSPESKE